MKIDDMCKTIAKGPLTFEIEWVYDEDADTSLIGKYKAKGPEEGYIDRQKGVLYGEEVCEPEHPCDTCDKDTGNCELYRGDPPACKLLREYDEAYDEWNDNYGLEILADELGSTWERHGYEFFVPYAGGEKPGSEHYVKYAIQNYERITGFERDRWWFMGCVVTLFVDGIEIESESLWGIESDCGDDYITEVEYERITELMPSEYEDKLAEVLEALKEGNWEDD